MRFLDSFHLLPFLDTLASLITAFVFGTAIGAERQYRQRSAGLRTNVLVALGAAAFADLGTRIGGPNSTQVVAYVVSGVGFLGAGAIMKEGLNIRGLNTAATLWCSAAVGAACGVGLIAEGALLTLFVIAGNTLLRPVVNSINRIPIDEESSEATYVVRVTASVEGAAEAREALIDALDAANYPVSEVESEDRGDETTDIAATLVANAVVPEELDELVTRLEERADVEHATWESVAKA
jgi:putative Mg2+ transporter-C (MgtC) family protein